MIACGSGPCRGRKVRERQPLPCPQRFPLVPAPYGQQVPPLGQQKVSTSETQSAVHPNAGSQQVGSCAQTVATQGSLQPVEHSAAPAVQTLWHWQGGCVVVVVVVVGVVVVLVVVVEVVEVVVVVVGGRVVVVDVVVVGGRVVVVVVEVVVVVVVG